MKALIESNAKAANNESCKEQSLLGKPPPLSVCEDDTALLAAMTSVNLHPVRAKMADDLAQSDHTSAKLRLDQI